MDSLFIPWFYFLFSVPLFANGELPRLICLVLDVKLSPSVCLPLVMEGQC